MPSRHEKSFFDTPREWSRLKHRVLEYYLEPWAAKVGTLASTIYVVDTFAGRGTYDDPDTGAVTDGSPVIEVRRAEAYTARRAGRRLQVICVEHNAEHFARLTERIGDSPVSPILIHDEFANAVPQIQQIIGAAPALLLFDPIGLKAINAIDCRPLLHRVGPTDVFIIVHFGVVHRVGGMLTADGEPKPQLSRAPALAATIDSFFGGRRWREVAVNPSLSAEDRSHAYLDIYFEDVLGERYRFKSAYAVTEAYGGATKYWLVHATGHRDGVDIMNDAIVKVDDDLHLTSVSRPGMLPGIAASLVEAHRETIRRTLRDRVVAVVGAGPPAGVPCQSLCDTLLPEFFGRVKSGDYRKAIKKLVKEGILLRQARLAASLEDSELIRLAGPATPER